MAVLQLKNKQLSVSINSFGAELCSLKFKGEELLWQGDKNIWPRHAPVLFPIVGKLKDNKFNYKGQAYNLTQHGFARDMEFILTEQSESVLGFELTASEDTLKIYPFHFSLTIRYELKQNELKVLYKIFNPDNKDMLFSIGAHPGFNYKRNGNGSLSDFILEFERDSLICEKLKDGLLTGETYVLDLKNRQLPLNITLFENDALVFKNSQINSISLFSKKTSAMITLNCKDWPYFGIWTKKGCEDFICLEPWYGVADSQQTTGDLEEKEGVLNLPALQSLKREFTIEIE